MLDKEQQLLHNSTQTKQIGYEQKNAIIIEENSLVWAF
jgi:hypothetical protein